MSFNDPFFTDPDYMQKQQRKFFVGFVVYALVMTAGLFFVLSYIGNSIHQEGGVAHMIGGFIKEVKESSK